MLSQFQIYDKLVCDSEHALFSARMFFPEFSDKIEMYYSPLKYIANERQDERTQNIGNSDKKIILMLGGDRWIKNAYRGLMAIDELFTENKLNDYIVHVVGGIPKDIRKRLHKNNRIIGMGYLSSQELENEYKRCDIFFYPTLNEGFGYPPLEAMKYNKTCVIAADSSLLGLFEGSVYFANPYDITELKIRLYQASEVKIAPQLVSQKFKKINEIQKTDLDKMCTLICSGDSSKTAS